MIRKVAYGSLALAAVGTFIFGDDAWSYLTCGAQSVREAVRDEVPLDFEIERARQEVDDLVPEIRKSMHLIAKERVQVAQLEEQIARRLAEADTELEYFDRYDYVVINDDLDRAVENMRAIRVAESCRITDRRNTKPWKT